MAEGVGLTSAAPPADSARWRSLRLERRSNPFRRFDRRPARFAWPAENRMAEGVGFEPTVPFGTAVFKTAAFNHSATPPWIVRGGLRRGNLSRFAGLSNRGFGSLRKPPEIFSLPARGTRCHVVAEAGRDRRFPTGFPFPVTPANRAGRPGRTRGPCRQERR